MNLDVILKSILIDRAMKLDFIDGFEFSNLGVQSPVKFHIDEILGYSRDRDQIKLFLSSRLFHRKFSSVGGVPTGGTAWACLVADELEIPYFGIKGHETYGARNIGKHPLLIEDVVTTGKSFDKNAGIVSGHSGIRPDCFGIFSYGFRNDIHSLFYFADVRKSLNEMDNLSKYEISDRKGGFSDDEMRRIIDQWHGKAKERYDKITKAEREGL